MKEETTCTTNQATARKRQLTAKNVNVLRLKYYSVFSFMSFPVNFIMSDFSLQYQHTFKLRKFITEDFF